MHFKERIQLSDMINILKKYQPVILAVILFFAFMVATLRFTTYKKDQWEKDAKSHLLEILVTKKTKLERALYSRIHYTRSVAAYVSLRPGITPPEFDNLAAELIKEDTVISTMALSPGCIISAIYPAKGHEAAIGLNLLSHPERKEIVEKTIETREVYVAGPVELVEGGLAFISYNPIFDKTKGLEKDFWGVTDIVIRQAALLNEARMMLIEDGNHFALRGYNGTGNAGRIFWGDPKVFDLKPVTVNIELPYGNWVLGAVPERGWASYLDQDKFLLIILLISSGLISILIGLFTQAILRIRINEQNLRKLNATKDKLFSIIAHDLKSPFNTLLGFADILEEQFESLSEQEVRNILRTVRKTTNETYNLLTDLLNWSQIQRGHIMLDPGWHQLHKIADRSVLLLTGTAEKKGITISNEIEDGHEGYFDEDTIGLVIRNLISNAIKFTERGGSVRLISSETMNRVALTVVDNGLGIKPEDQAGIFSLANQRPSRGTENERGTGLGLILCKEFTLLNKGSITLQSTPGKGSRFTISLPSPKRQK